MAWVLESSPGFSIDGRRLEEALRWLLRETGWELVEPAAAVREQLTDCVLTGPLRPIGVEELPELVFPSCGVAFRVEEGRLLLESASGGEA